MKWLLTLAVLAALSCSGQTYRYVNYDTGSDLNTGADTTHPWKHAPGMQGLNPDGTPTGDGCTDTCAAFTPGANKYVILEGGVVWPSTVLPWAYATGGTSSTQLYGCAGTGCFGIGSAVDFGLPAWNKGVVNSIALLHDFGGWDPASPPTISCSGGGGSGAAATPTVLPATVSTYVQGLIYKIDMVSGGSGYTSAPTCLLVGGSGVAVLVADIDRPIIDFGAKSTPKVVWNLGNNSSFPNTYSPGLTPSGAYTRISGIEFRNMIVQSVGDTPAKAETAMAVSVHGAHTTVNNIYAHGMWISCQIIDGDCTTFAPLFKHGAISFGAEYEEISNNILENGEAALISTSATVAVGICPSTAVGEPCQFGNFGIDGATQAFGPVSIYGNSLFGGNWQIRLSGNRWAGTEPTLVYNNDLWLTMYDINPSGHVNARYWAPTGNQQIIAWNNLIHNQVGGTSSQLQCPPGPSYTFFNEVIWGIGSGTQGYSLDLHEAGTTGGCTLNLYNDTIYSPLGTGVCVNTENATNTTTITMQNLHCISTTALNPFWSTATNNVFQNYAGSTVAANVQAASVSQSYATACTSQGYCPLNQFAPTSNSGDTVTFASGSGTQNLTALCSGNLTPLCSDILGNARPTLGGWQAGAYWYGGSGPPTLTLSSSLAICNPVSGQAGCHPALSGTLSFSAAWILQRNGTQISSGTGTSVSYTDTTPALNTFQNVYTLISSGAVSATATVSNVGSRCAGWPCH